MNKCIGCGIKLQTTDETKLGYVVGDKDYCMRCFKLINYGEKKDTNLTFNNKKLIDYLNKKATKILFLIDFLNINNETIKLFNALSKNKILVVTKYDLYKNYLKDFKIINYLKNEYQIKNKIMVLSSLNNYNIRNIESELVNGCYITGYINSGKSSLINKLMRSNTLTVSDLPNTTQEFNKINYNDLTIYDAVGFKLNDFDYKLNNIKKLEIKNRIKPLTYQMKKDEIIEIDEFLKIKVLSETNMTFYMSNNLKIAKNYKLNLNNEKIKVEKNTDLVLPGIGFINIKGSCHIMVEANIDYEFRPSIFGGYNE